MLALQLHQPYHLLICGRFVSEKQWIHMERVMDEYELIIGVSGTTYLEVAGQRYEIGAGDMLLLQPGERHRGYQASAPGVSFYWFHFLTPEHVPSGEQEGSIPRYAACPSPDRVHILARQLLHAANGGYRTARAQDYFLSCLLIELAEQLQQAERLGQTDARMNELLEWARLHALDPDITVERIALRMGYNKDYLSRMFKRRFGYGLLSYIHQIKLDAAKKLLTTTRLHVKEVADRIGMDDVKHFSKWFKRQSGVSPSAYRSAFLHTRLNDQ